ncbi:autotransporter outer membrane beta-barrel domain-containing protein [Pseudomonas sp. McL0111]|uniref:autotransporter outer membrane beta-barrel domain-containing protein n=1 Tax=Pseudomonas sp. McL0111 TaxID=3457357 RepID=UPI00403E8B6E
MAVQHKYRPEHLALAIALAVSCVDVSMAQQAEVSAVTDAQDPKPRKKRPVKAVPLDDDIFKIKEFIGPLEHSAWTADPQEQKTPNPRPPAIPVEFDAVFYELLDFPEPETVEASVEENPFNKFKNAYTTQHTILSKPLENINGVSLQLGEADDLLVISSGAQWDGRIDGGKGKNGLLLNASQGGEIGETANFAGMRVARGEWRLQHEFHGDTEIKTGASLFNNGLIKGDAYVESNAVYGGHGAVTNLYVDGALVASPDLGSPIINGNLEFSEGAIFSYGVNGKGYSTPVLVEGTAVLANAAFQVHGVPGDYANSTVHSVLLAEKIEGEFGEITNNLAFMKPTLSYSANQVALTYQRNAVAFEQLADSESGKALARSVDTSKAATSNTAIRTLVNSNKTTATAAIEQLAAGSNANLANATLNSINPVSASMLSAMNQLDSNGSSRSANAPSLAAGGEDSGRVWLQALGHGGKVDRDFDTLKHSTQGLVLGADWRLDEQWHVGLMGGKSQTRLDARQFDGDLDSWHLGAYAVRQDGPFALRLGASYGGHDGSGKRRVAFSGFSNHLKSNYDANTQQAFAEVGYNLGRGNVSIEPFASLGYQRYQRDDYTEKGGDAALKVHGQTQDNLSSTLGLRVAKINRLDNGMQLTPRLSASVKHTYGELSNETRQQLVSGGKSFEVAGAETDRNSLMLDAGLDLTLSARHTVGVGLTAEAGTDSRSHGVMGQWRMAF